MDELKLKLNSGIVKNLIMNTISKVIKQKLGYDVNVLLNDLSVETKDGKIHIHVNADGEMKYSDLLNLISR